MVAPASTRITSPYGESEDYDGWHNGIDFAWDVWGDTPVVAFQAGLVTFVGVYPGWEGRGTVVVIDHGNGVVSWSCHLAGVNVSPGQWVAEGQRVGTMGATGYTFGVHLHWMIYLNGRVVDPTPYLTASAGGGTTPFDPEEEEMAKVYEDRGNAAPFPHTGKFYIGAPGSWLVVDNKDFGGDDFVRGLLAAKFGPIEGTTTNELVGIRKTWLALAPKSSGTIPPIDYDALAKALAKQISVPTAAQNGAAARDAIIKKES